MEIISVKITSVFETGAVKAKANAVLGRFGVRGIKVCEGKSGLFVAMPSYKSAKGKYIDIFFPMDKEAKEELAGAVLRAYAEKGQAGRVVRVMILGIPNVGKSSFINRMILGGGAGKAAVQDRPGVTRQNRWFTVGKGFELLDTPGVLWPKFEDQSVGLNLAYTGAVKDEILDMETLGCHLMAYLGTNYPEALRTGYKLPSLPERQDGEEDVAWGYRLLEAAGKKRGFLISGGEVDTERMAKILLDEYRAGKLGRFTLEMPGLS